MKRIKFFLRLVANDYLHTNEFFCRCHISTYASCTRCNTDLHESILYVLRGCTTLRDFWYRLVKQSEWPEFFSAGLYHWLISNLRAKWMVKGHE